MRRSVWIILGSLTAAILLVNLFIQNPTFNTYEELIDFYYKTHQFQKAEKVYLKMIQADSLNPDNYYGHIISHFNIPSRVVTGRNKTIYRDDEPIFDFYNKISQSTNPNQRDLGNYGLGLIYSIQDDYNRSLDYFFQVSNKKLKYLNNSIGSVYMMNSKHDTAETYLLNEIKNEGNVSGAYSNLITLYFKTNQLLKVGALIDNHLLKYFSNADLREYYFRTSKIGKYFLSLIMMGVNSLDLKSFTAALLIMLIWLFYLRRIDVFEPEKWKYIIYTFLLGMFFSYGTFFLSDINKHWLGFDLTGGVFNDFWYCFIGIGLIEELVKLIPFLIILKFTREVNEPIDYIIYLSVSALGFAFVENISYFHGFGLQIIHGRAMISVVVHMICSSIIGYGLFLGFGGSRTRLIGRLIIFLLIAGFVHGFFDFWMVNEKIRNLSFISILMLVVCVVIWNLFINNTLNFSMPEGSDNKALSHQKLLDYLVYGLSGVLIFEYLIISMSYGPSVGNSSFLSSVKGGTYLIAFVSISLSTFQLKRNYMGRIKFLSVNSEDFNLLVGEKLVIYKFIEDIHHAFPLSGEIVSRVKIQSDPNWYMIKLDNSIEHFRVCKSHVMIKTKNNMPLKPGLETSVAVYMIKKDETVTNKIKLKSDFVFVDWAEVRFKNVEFKIELAENKGSKINKFS